MSGFTDIHSHFLYGVDDGAKSREIMEAMLDTAYKDNIRRLVATPHVTPGVKPFNREEFQSRLDEAKEYCEKMGYDIELFLGAENLYTPAMPGYAESNELMTLADTSYLLVEFIPDVDIREIWDTVDLLCAKGYTPVIAHVERYKSLTFREAKKIKDSYDVVYQMNCSTVIDEKGFWAKRSIQKFLKNELISCLACDAHDCHRRRYKMSEAYKVVKNAYGARYADDLTGKLQITSNV